MTATPRRLAINVATDDMDGNSKYLLAMTYAGDYVVMSMADMTVMAAYVGFLMGPGG